MNNQTTIRFSQAEKQASDNISKILNKENKYVRTEKEILRSVFGR